MNSVTYGFCRLVSYLNLIPRYGRLYTLVTKDGRLVRGERKAVWRWQRYGCWGLNLLDRMDLYWPYHDEAERRRVVNLLKPRKGSAETWGVILILALLAVSVLVLLLSD